MFKQNLRTNSGAISMSEIEASSMAKPISTQKKKKKKKNQTTTTTTTLNHESTRIMTTVHGFQTCEVEPRFAWFTEFFIYAGF